MNKKEKYKIVFDTNLIRQNSEDSKNVLFNNTLQDIFNFIHSNNIEDRVSLAITETVKDERLIQIKEQTVKYLNDCNKINNFINKIGINKKFNLNLNIIKKLIKKNFSKYLADLDIEIIKNSKIDRKILERSLDRTRPFSDKGDKGFKDTLIWLSILDDAKKNKKINYIFCSENTHDFEQNYLSEEFKLISKSEFVYLINIIELKEYLDKEVKLNLKLKENNVIVEQELKQRIGDIMVRFNYYKNKNDTFFGGGVGGGSSFNYATGYSIKSILETEKDEFTGFNFKDIRINDINEIKKDIYLIDASLETKKVYANNHQGGGGGSWANSLGMTLYNGSETYAIVINYHRKSGIIDISHINGQSTYNFYGY